MLLRELQEQHVPSKRGKMSPWGMETEINLTRNTKWTLLVRWPDPYLSLQKGTRGWNQKKSAVVWILGNTSFLGAAVYCQELSQIMYYYFELFSSMWDNSVIFSAPRTGFYYAQPVIEHRYVHLFCYKHPDGQPVIPPNYFTTSYMITIEYMESVKGFCLSCFLQRHIAYIYIVNQSVITRNNYYWKIIQ